MSKFVTSIQLSDLALQANSDEMALAEIRCKILDKEAQIAPIEAQAELACARGGGKNDAERKSHGIDYLASHPDYGALKEELLALKSQEALARATLSNSSRSLAVGALIFAAEHGVTNVPSLK